MMRAPLVLLLTAVLGACAPMAIQPLTIERVRAEPAGHLSFTSAQGFFKVYGDILDGTRQCFLHQKTEKQVIVDDSHDLATPLANVSVVLVHGASGRDAYLVTDVRGSEGDTRVDIYYVDDKLAPMAESMRAWILEDAPPCPPQPVQPI